MEFTNFKLTKTITKYGTPWEEYATVDITTGFWRWKKTVTHKIFKTGVFWKFTNTGKFTPGEYIENLYDSCKAQGDYYA